MLLNMIFLVLVVAILLWLGIFYWWRTSERRLVQSRLERFAGSGGHPDEAAANTDGADRWQEMFRKVGQQMTPPQWSRHYDRLLLQAGWNIRSPEYLAGVALLMLVMGLFGWSLGGLLVGILLAVLAFMVVQMLLKGAVERRAKKFTAQLSDALVLIANSLRSGFSFMQAIELVSKEMRPPISREFGRLLNEMNLGAGADDALENLTRRVASLELELVSTAVLIQRQVGGNLAEVLDTIAETIRDRARMRREISALTAQGRLSGFIVGALPIALAVYIFVVSPEFISLLWTDPLGQVMIGGAVVMQLIGAFIISKIIAIEV